MAWRSLLSTVSATAAALVLLPAVGQADSTVWLCRPGVAPDPCTPGLSTTRLSPAGAVLGAVKVRADRKPPVDCFYVYPTVSTQKTENADLTIDPEQRRVALYQAARFSQHCRVYAPMYRQLTLQGVTGARSPVGRAIAYADVKAAWDEYRTRYGHGRGVVLIGHSQGAFMLRALMRNEIDGHRTVRKRLVSALLLGANVAVRKGSGIGGDFRHIGACRTAAQTGCVVAYSTFNTPVPADAAFGRLAGSGPTANPAAPADQEVLCTNPAALGGGAGTLDPIFPVVTESGPRTVWTVAPGSYRARCSSAGGARVLQVSSLGGAPVLKPSPLPSWGLHTVDVNLALGNLVDLVGRQARRYASR